MLESFIGLSDEAMEKHFSVAEYGDFTLTDAIRPSYDLKVIPHSGYKIAEYIDPTVSGDDGWTTDMLIAAVSKEKLFSAFMDLLDPLGEEVDVAFMSSHNTDVEYNQEYVRFGIEMSVFQSKLWDYEKLLSDDGCAGIAVFNSESKREVQLEERKTLVVYSKNMLPFENILARYNILRQQQMQFIFDAEHVHLSSSEYYEKFQEMVEAFGAEIAN